MIEHLCPGSDPAKPGWQPNSFTQQNWLLLTINFNEDLNNDGDSSDVLGPASVKKAFKTISTSRHHKILPLELPTFETTISETGTGFGAPGSGVPVTLESKLSEDGYEFGITKRF